MDAETKKEYMKIYLKEYRKNNKEKIDKLNKDWCRANPDKKRAHAQKYKTKNRDILNAKERERYHNNIEHQRERSKVYQKTHTKEINEKCKKWNRENPEKFMLTRCKARAKQKGIEFTITLEDIHIPSHCPVLNIPLFVSIGRMTNNSPSLDRIDNDRGYIPGNVLVISNRANKIKGNSTPDELIRIGMFYKSYGYDI